MVVTTIARELTIKPMIGTFPVQLQQSIPYADDDIIITEFKLYITVGGIPHLLSLDQGCRCTVSEGIHEVMIGLDSTMNVNTSFADELDPIHGMFWTWNSGYVNLKIEGYSAHSPQKNKLLQFHMGGYLHPNTTAFSIAIPSTGNITLLMDIGPLLNALNTSHQSVVMSPGAIAKQLSTLLYHHISVRQ